jgi:arginine exporter protein ArgO
LTISKKYVIISIETKEKGIDFMFMFMAHTWNLMRIAGAAFLLWIAVSAIEVALGNGASGATYHTLNLFNLLF